MRHWIFQLTFDIQQSSEQAEDALSRGVVASLHSLTKTLTNDSPVSSGSSGNATSCMGPISVAMGKAGMLEAFVCQVTSLTILVHLIGRKLMKEVITWKLQ